MRMHLLRSILQHSTLVVIAPASSGAVEHVIVFVKPKLHYCTKRFQCVMLWHLRISSYTPYWAATMDSSTNILPNTSG
ncbi:unnamed protein product [Gongylonema pulchrum]|uniref:Secreted protein n=1 Tax=Gongylonema pulchrum TaxID=637853 RepID=A0A183EUZ9_9BILA|nr:unnamed protein product [Gongylonema pulchrum]